MKWFHRLLLFGGLLTSLASSACAADGPHWIWASGKQAGEHRVVLRTRFPLSGNLSKARLWLANAYCDCEVFLNGKLLRRIRSYQRPSRLVLEPLHSGRNQLDFICRGVAGPSALAVRLELGKTTLGTDSSWQVASLNKPLSRWEDLAQLSWTEATSFGSLDSRVWNSVEVATHVADDYTQWKRALTQTGSTAAEKLWVQPGFQVERLYSAGEGEGSWISLAEDPQGRWIIGHEEKGLLRVALDGHGSAHVEKLNVPVEECRGLLFAHDSLYAMGNKSLSLFRLRDTNNDDRFDKIERIKKFAGGTGHGRNQLALGPDGKLYAIFGDSVEQPADAKYLAAPVPYPDDIQKTQNGFVARTDAQGKHWEIVVRGLRNPYGLGFNTQGDLFTYDADAEYDMGSSWYRPTRILHLLPGGDYGWRRVTRRWPPYNPDRTTIPQPTLDTGRGSPTAVAFGAGSKFPAPYRRAMYALDWSYGRILAVHWQACGSSYVGDHEVFLRGSPLNVTDIEFGRDGAMYFVTGGRKTQSGLYRVRYVGDKMPTMKQTPQQVAVARHAQNVRQLRRQLESLRADSSSETLETAWKHLDSSDPWIRHAARTVVEAQPVGIWRKRTLEEKNIDRFLSAGLALQRFGKDHDRELLGRRLVALDARRLLPWQQLEWADLCRRQLASSDANDPKWDPVFEQLRLIFPANDFLLDQQLSSLLAKRDNGQLVPLAMRLLEESRAAGIQRRQMHWLFLLSTQSQGWTRELRDRYFVALRDMDTFEAGEGMPTFRRLIRTAAIENLPEKDRREWQKRFQKHAAELIPKLPPARTTRVKQWGLSDFQGLQSELEKKRNLTRGKEMFATARCIVCHRLGTQGGLSGPDLTNIAGRFAARDLLASILEPSAVISEKYVNTLFVMNDGRILTGRPQVNDFRSPTIQLVSNLLTPEKTISIPKKEIEQRHVSKNSPMPSGLVDGLEKQEILDLLAYLLRK